MNLQCYNCTIWILCWNINGKCLLWGRIQPSIWKSYVEHKNDRYNGEITKRNSWVVRSGNKKEISRWKKKVERKNCSKHAEERTCLFFNFNFNFIKQKFLIGCLYRMTCYVCLHTRISPLLVIYTHKKKLIENDY